MRPHRFLSHAVCGLIPHCPRCGGEMAMHLRITRYFVENADWHAAQQRYADFIAQTRDAKTVFLELGIGFNTPSIIPYPFEQMTFHNPQATLIRVNRDHAEGFAQTAAQTLALRDYVADIFNIWLAA